MNKAFEKYLEEAIGHENALVAFSAFNKPASVSVRRNPFKQISAHEFHVDGAPVSCLNEINNPSDKMEPLRNHA